MKAGLFAHLATLTLEEKSELITAKDLHDPVAYHAFVEARKALHQPIPPNEHIGYAGHHWLKSNPQLTGSADAGDWIVAQWSPTTLRWYPSNGLASMEKPLYGNGLMSHFEWKGHVPLPELSQGN